MNAPRIAELLRELADAFDDVEAEPVEKARHRARPRARSFPAPLGKPTDIDMARADRELKRRGIQR